MSIQRILIIGNAAGGKTRLAQKLSLIHKLPLTHVDSVQFVPPMNIRNLDETRKILAEISSRPQWVIDGHGPLDQLESRFLTADRIVFVDLPLFIHYFLFFKRQIKNLWSPRPELPAGCNELSLKHTLKVIKSMWKMHRQMRPELIKILSRTHLQPKLIYIDTLKKWQQIYSSGLD